MVASGIKVTIVPVLSVSPISFNLEVGIHFLYFCLYIFPFLCTLTSNQSDNAFTTEAPTQCNQPEIL
jgi:hypothetical protein